MIDIDALKANQTLSFNNKNGPKHNNTIAKTANETLFAMLFKQQHFPAYVVPAQMRKKVRQKLFRLEYYCSSKAHTNNLQLSYSDARSRNWPSKLSRLCRTTFDEMMMMKGGLMPLDI